MEPLLIFTLLCTPLSVRSASGFEVYAFCDRRVLALVDGAFERQRRSWMADLAPTLTTILVLDTGLNTAACPRNIEWAVVKKATGYTLVISPRSLDKLDAAMDRLLRTIAGEQEVASLAAGCAM